MAVDELKGKFQVGFADRNPCIAVMAAISSTIQVVQPPLFGPVSKLV